MVQQDVNPPLFSEDMVVCIEIPGNIYKKSINKNCIYRVSRYNIHIQNMFYFFKYFSIKSIITIYNSTNYMEYLRIIITKYVQNFHARNSKTLMRKKHQK